MPTLSARQLLRRLAAPFALSFLALTAVLIANYVSKPVWGPSRASVEGVLLAVPFTAAITIPMAVLLSVLIVFARLRREGMLDAVRREPNGIRRLVMPVLGGAAVVTIMTFVVNSQLVPRANERLATLSSGAAHARGDREMTIGELRAEASKARALTSNDGAALASRYEVEIQKKFAIASAVLVLALTGVAIVFVFPRGGVFVLTAAGCTVFALYYVTLVAGESLADRLILSPFVAMWMANGVFLAFALFVLWSLPRRAPGLGSVSLGT